jgi:Tfp pilus assembly protein PilF
VVIQQLRPKDPAAAKKHTDEAHRLIDNYRGNTDDLRAAANEIELAIQGDPGYARAYTALARFYFEEASGGGQSTDLELKRLGYTALEKARDLDPDLAEVHMLYAQREIEERRFAEAAQSIDKVESLKVYPVWVALTRAWLYKAQGDREKAIGVYRELIDSGVKDNRAKIISHEALISYYRDRYDFDNADKYHRQLIALTPGDAWVRGNYASFLLYRKGDYDGAIRYAREALDIMQYGNAEETLAMALYTKWAHVLLDEKNPEQARIYFEQARAIYPDFRLALRKAKSWPVLHTTAEAFETSGVMELG